MLVVFAISVAPKSYFHELLANHKDIIGCTHAPGSAPCAHQQPFNCHFDDLVVTAPFLFATMGFYATKPIEQISDHVFYSSHLTSFVLLHKAGRGPPQI